MTVWGMTLLELPVLEVVPTVPAAGFLSYAWLLIAIPALSATVLLLVGRAGDRWGHYLGVGGAAGVVRHRRLLLRPAAGPGRGRAGGLAAALRLDLHRRVADRGRAADRPAVDRLRPADHRGGRPDPHLLDRLHGPRRAPSPVLRLPESVHRLHAAAGAGRQLPGALRGLGGRRSGVLPADRVLAAQADRGDGGQEGLRGQPGRRHGHVAGDHGDAGLLRLLGLRRRQRRDGGRRGDQGDHPGPAPAARRLRQVGPGAAAVLVARRHGGPDPGVGPDPCGHDGHGRGLSGDPQPRRLRSSPRRPARPWSWWARSPCWWGPGSAAPRTTSRRLWPARRCRRSAT